MTAGQLRKEDEFGAFDASGPVWINGELCSTPDAWVPALDHGVLVGDGVFETVKVIQGKCFALTRHLQRLASSAAGLYMPEPDLDIIRKAALDVVAASPAWELSRIRITFTSGPGPLSSDRGGAFPTTVIAVARQLPFVGAADVWPAPWPRNEFGALAGIKTTSYGDNVKALAFAKSRGSSEAIFANTAGDLCEGSGSNVFLVRGGRVITPPLSSGCLAGVTRALVLEWLDGDEENIPFAELAEADEAFLTSTLRDIMPIRAVGGAELPSAPGPVTQKVIDQFAMRSAADLDP